MPESKTAARSRQYKEVQALDKQMKALIAKAKKARDKKRKAELIQEHEQKKAEMLARHEAELAAIEAGNEGGDVGEAPAEAEAEAESEAEAAAPDAAASAEAEEAVPAPAPAPAAEENKTTSESLGSMKKRHAHEMRTMIKEFDTKIKAAKKKKALKRELQVEKAKAEAEMEARHAAELAAHPDNSGEGASGAAASSGADGSEAAAAMAADAGTGFRITVGRKSKSQLKKERKAAEVAKRRAEAQAAVDALGETKRQKEAAAIADRLLPQRLRIVSIVPDGHCMFAATLHQLGEPASEVMALRKQVVDHIRANRDEYAPFMMNAAGSTMTDDQFEAYCVRMGTTPAWGGQLELAALTAVVNRPIHIYNAQETIVMGEDKAGDPLRLSYHLHELSLGEHYNSVVAFPDDA